MFGQINVNAKEWTKQSLTNEINASKKELEKLNAEIAAQKAKYYELKGKHDSYTT